MPIEGAAHVRNRARQTTSFSSGNFLKKCELADSVTPAHGVGPEPRESTTMLQDGTSINSHSGGRCHLGIVADRLPRGAAAVLRGVSG